MSCNQLNFMSMALVCSGVILPFTILSTIALLVCSGVCGCLCPISSFMILIYTTSCAMIYRPASSVSVAYVMKFLMICTMLRIAPLFTGIAASLERKKWSLALPRDLGLLR